MPIQLCMHTVHFSAKKVPIYMRVTSAFVVPNNKCEALYGQQVTMATAMIIIGCISCKRDSIGMLCTGPTQLTGKRAQIACGVDAGSSDNRPRAKSQSRGMGPCRMAGSEVCGPAPRRHARAHIKVHALVENQSSRAWFPF